jgi:AAA+ ATPase superfamily predicted ATPase
LLVVFGSRRVGKTRLLTHWLKPRNGLYSQAIEAPAPIQIEQVMRDIGPALKTNITRKNWVELLELFSLQKGHSILCLHEFPYLVASDPSLPSVLQRWLDHQRPKSFTLVTGRIKTSHLWRVLVPAETLWVEPTMVVTPRDLNP